MKIDSFLQILWAAILFVKVLQLEERLREKLTSVLSDFGAQRVASRPSS